MSTVKQRLQADINTPIGRFLLKATEAHNLCVELQEQAADLMAGEPEETRNICVNIIGEACNDIRIAMAIAHDPQSVDNCFDEEEETNG